MSWFAVPQKKSPTPEPTLKASDRAALEEFVGRYFGTWSARDIDGYGRCFHPNARIWFGAGSSLGLPEFIESQQRAHAETPVRLTENPLSWDGDVNNGLAHVRVHWELHRGDSSVRGYDFFTLVFSDGRWQIIALAFNEE